MPKSKKITNYGLRQNYKRRAQIGSIKDKLYFKCIYCPFICLQFTELVEHQGIKHKESKDVTDKDT